MPGLDFSKVGDGGDTWSCSMYGLPYPIYFYYYSRTTLDSVFSYANSVRDSMPLGNCPSILSIQFAPYVDITDLSLTSIAYDYERFGKLDPSRPPVSGTPRVYRISKIFEDRRRKVIGQFPTYPKSGKQIGPGKTRYWRNESILMNYPYSFALLSDGISPPLHIKYHLCNDHSVSKVEVRNTLSDRCSYGIFVQGYKGDANGVLEAVVSGDAHELPSSSSAYNQWYATSKNSTAQSTKNTIDSAFFQASSTSQQSALMSSQARQSANLSNMTGFFGGGSLLGNVLGGVGNVMNNSLSVKHANQSASLNSSLARQSATMSKDQAIKSVMAQVRDLSSTPATMQSMGSDFVYGFNKQGSALKLFRFGLTTEYSTKLGDYFAMYGYKQNRMLPLWKHLRTRYYYNYIKTVDIKLKGNQSISKENLEIMRAIFNKGVTIWHVQRKGVIPLSYYYDNYEISIFGDKG